MNLFLDQKGSDLYVDVEGRIDANNALEFQNKLEEIDDSINRVVFDLKNLRYISSAGLRVFLLLYKNMNSRNGDIIIKNPNNLVFSIFNSTGMTDLFTVDNS